MADVRLINVNSLNEGLVKLGPLKPSKGSRAKVRYVDMICAFDIETTSLPDIKQGLMYVWQWHFDGWATIYGRTWDEFRDFAEMVCGEIPIGYRLVVYVHNLSFEFQFLRNVYNFSNDEVFAIARRKILKCTMWDKIELRCSYLQSNMSLAQFCKKMGAEHRKLSGEEFDYNKERYPWTELTDMELKYCQNDVVGLVESIKIEMQRDNDDLYTIPLTSTGYARRAAKNIMYYIRKKEYQITPEIYMKLRQAFRGGNTHANRFFSGMILKNVKSADRSSSYPDVQCNCKFPVGEWTRRNINSTNIDKYLMHGYPLLIEVALKNVRLKEKYWPVPYLTRDKSRKIVNGAYDNGRILSADYLETTLTDVDWGIVDAEYNFDGVEIISGFSNRYAELPKEFIKLICGFYRDKCKLKGDEDKKLYYHLSKQLLNSLYGMTAQDPLKPDIEFNDGAFSLEMGDIYERCEKYNKKCWLPYAWGVYTTAWARLRLEEGIRLAGENLVYVDTDSVKYLGEIDWNEYNAERISDSKKSGAWGVDANLHPHYMGVYEMEEGYDKFITLGAKKYAYEQNGELGVTVSGVLKFKGAKELKNLENFTPGFVFREAGGTASWYNDDNYGELIKEGRKINIGPNICILPSTYQIGLSEDYDALLCKILKDERQYIALKQDLWYNKVYGLKP